MEKNNIEIGRKYHIGDIECEAVVYNKDKEVLMLREQDGNISFVLGDFVVKGNEIDYKTIRSYMVKNNEFIDCINKGMAGAVVSSITVANVIKDITEVLHDKYYKIPSYLLEVVAEWYCTQAQK